MAQIRQGLVIYQATGTEVTRTYSLGLLAEACGIAGQIEEGLCILDETLGLAHKNGERFYEAELYRLKGELTLQKLSVISCQLLAPNTQSEDLQEATALLAALGGQETERKRKAQGVRSPPLVRSLLELKNHAQNSFVAAVSRAS